MPSTSKLLLTKEQRERLKRPLGELMAGTPAECNTALKASVAGERPPRLILVGDTVCRNAVQSGIVPDVMIIDNKEMRGEAEQFAHGSAHVFRTVNAAGTIEMDAWKTIDEAITKANSIVIVEGEEDLLTLVAILVSPTRSLVVYGQPGQGIVLVRVTAEAKKEIGEIVERMERQG